MGSISLSIDLDPFPYVLSAPLGRLSSSLLLPSVFEYASNLRSAFTLFNLVEPAREREVVFSSLLHSSFTSTECLSFSSSIVTHNEPRPAQGSDGQ